MPELSSLFCVALRASCVRFRLRVRPPHPRQQPIVSEPQKAAQCWVIDRAARPGSSATANLTSAQEILPFDLQDSHDNTLACRLSPSAMYSP